MKAVYEATYDVPELGIERGDVVTLRPSHPTNPLLVTKRRDHAAMADILDHVARFSPVSVSLSSPQEAPADELRRQLLRRCSPPPASQRTRRRISLLP